MVVFKFKAQDILILVVAVEEDPPSLRGHTEPELCLPDKPLGVARTDDVTTSGQ